MYGNELIESADTAERNPDILRAEMSLLATPVSQQFSEYTYAAVKNVESQCAVDIKTVCSDANIELQNRLIDDKMMSRKLTSDRVSDGAKLIKSIQSVYHRNSDNAVARPEFVHRTLSGKKDKSEAKPVPAADAPVLQPAAFPNGNGQAAAEGRPAGGPGMKSLSPGPIIKKFDETSADAKNSGPTVSQMLAGRGGRGGRGGGPAGRGGRGPGRGGAMSALGNVGTVAQEITDIAESAVESGADPIAAITNSGLVGGRGAGRGGRGNGVMGRGMAGGRFAGGRGRGSGQSQQGDALPDAPPQQGGAGRFVDTIKSIFMPGVTKAAPGSPATPADNPMIKPAPPVRAVPISSTKVPSVLAPPAAGATVSAAPAVPIRDRKHGATPVPVAPVAPVGITTPASAAAKPVVAKAEPKPSTPAVLKTASTDAKSVAPAPLTAAGAATGSNVAPSTASGADTENVAIRPATEQGGPRLRGGKKKPNGVTVAGGRKLTKLKTREHSEWHKGWDRSDSDSDSDGDDDSDSEDESDFKKHRDCDEQPCDAVGPPSVPYDYIYSGELGFGATTDACLYQNHNQLSQPCAEAINNLYFVREQYWEAQPENQPFGHGRCALFVIGGIALIWGVRRWIYRGRIQKVRNFMNAIRGNEALKATIESQTGLVVPDPPKPCCNKKFRCAIVFAFLLFASLIASVDITGGIIEKIDERAEEDGNPGTTSVTAICIILAVWLVLIVTSVAIVKIAKVAYNYMTGMRTTPVTVIEPSAPLGYALLSQADAVGSKATEMTFRTVSYN